MNLGGYYNEAKADQGFDMTAVREKITVGKVYTVTITGKRDDENTNRKVKAKLIKKYKDFALFDMGGYKECFTYYDLWKMGVE